MTTVGGNVKELCTAATVGDLPTVKYHLETGMDPNFQHPEFMTTPLVEASRFGQVEAVRLLLQHGADPTIAADWEGCTPLEEAVKERHHEVVDVLLKNISPKDEDCLKHCIVIGMSLTDAPSNKERDLMAHLLTMGHCLVLVVEDSSAGMSSAIAATEKLCKNTGNQKVWVLCQTSLSDFFSTQSSSEETHWHPSHIDVWVHFSPDSKTAISRLISIIEWQLPFRGSMPKVLVLLDSLYSETSFAEQWEELQTSQRELCFWITVVMQPRWKRILYHAIGRQAWCEKVFDSLRSLHEAETKQSLDHPAVNIVELRRL